MTEQREPYIIASSEDPEEVLTIGALRFIRPLHGRMRIETNIARLTLHTQLLTEAEEAALQRFMMDFESEQEESSDEDEEEEGELKGAPAEFLRIDEG